jgi:uncharacterized phage protein (TIGR02220 family)
MKYNININQKAIIESNIDIDAIDAIILHSCMTFAHKSKCLKMEYHGKIYYWFSHDMLVEELPLLRIKKDSVYRRMKKMCELGLLSQHPDNGILGKSYYHIEELTLGFEYEPTDKNPRVYNSKAEHPAEKKPIDHNTINHNTITSLNNTPGFSLDFIPESSKKNDLDILCYDVITSFISITGKKIKLNDGRKKLISGRMKEGYGLEDFKNVITKKYKQWKDDLKMKEFITPETLFAASNFTKYIEQDEIKQGSTNKQGSTTGPTAIIPKGKSFGY